MTENDDGSGRPSKVTRLIDRHDLGDIGDELEARWTAEDPSERQSLRDLADFLNKEVLREVLVETSMDPILDDVENIYEVLVDEDGSTADRTRVERQLERDGVDVDELCSEFVSYQSVRRYLKNHRDAEYSGDNGDQEERVRESIQRLHNRTAAVTESKVAQCRDGGVLSLGENVRATVDVRIICEDCGTQFGTQELFDADGCDCP